MAKAASVGAKTVYDPLPCSVPASPACLSNDVSVLNFPAAVAVSTMSFFALAGTAFPCEGTLADAEADRRDCHGGHGGKGENAAD